MKKALSLNMATVSVNFPFWKKLRLAGLQMAPSPLLLSKPHYLWVSGAKYFAASPPNP